MLNPIPPTTQTYFVDLPLSRLHIMEVGNGEPLIIVPATISELENWQALAQFMAQWFRVYFFELPGHGESSAFQKKFSSSQVAELVEQLVDALGFKRFNLMGFSFGGILAMRTFKRLSNRINKLIFIAPCLDHRALPLSRSRLFLLDQFNQLLGSPTVRVWFCNLLRNKYAAFAIAETLHFIGHVERTIDLEKKLPRTQPSTMAVLNAQINEILTTEFDVESIKYQTPCYFAMSIHDPLLRFDTTLGILNNHFDEVNIVRLYYPFHQPKTPFTYTELNRDFYETVDMFMQRIR